jgi:hypothetical protein
MSIRRTATTIGAISLGLVALTACDKPTAQATVTVGSKSVQAEAADKCYANDKKLPPEIWQACMRAKPTHHITVPVGDKVHIGVDPEIADKGWLIVRGANELDTSELLKNKTYWSEDSAAVFTLPDPQTGQPSAVKSVTLNVLEATDAHGENVYRVIQFTLTRP